MCMFTEQLIDACQVIQKTLADFPVVWSKVYAAVDGIIFQMDEDTKWKYWYATKTITKLEPWKGINRKLI